MFRVSMPVSVKSLIAGVTVFLAVAAPALAGRYELVKGQGVEVCEAYQKGLNAMVPYGVSADVARKLQGTAPPSATGYLRASHPNFPELTAFSKPKLGRLNEQTRGTLLSKVDDFLWGRDANPAYYLTEEERRDWRGTPTEWEKARKGYDLRRSQRVSINYEHTRLDVDNDGTVDNIYVGSPNTGGRLLLVLNAYQTDIDHQKTRFVIVHPSHKEQRLGEFRSHFLGEFETPWSKRFGKTLVEDSLHYAHYDLFRYKDQTYFDLWWSKHPDFQGKRDEEVGRLRIYTIDQKQTREVCVYRFDYQLTK